jgi:hypothetical protein
MISFIAKSAVAIVVGSIAFQWAASMVEDDRRAVENPVKRVHLLDLSSMRKANEARYQALFKEFVVETEGRITEIEAGSGDNSWVRLDASTGILDSSSFRIPVPTTVAASYDKNGRIWVRCGSESGHILGHCKVMGYANPEKAAQQNKADRDAKVQALANTAREVVGAALNNVAASLPEQKAPARDPIMEKVAEKEEATIVTDDKGGQIITH